jgi:hypothetical protein
MPKVSSWRFTKQFSQYHFDPAVFDPRWDQLQGIGRFEGDWSQELAEVLETAEPATWRTRLDNKRYTLSPMIAKEEHDLIEANCDPNIVLLRMLHEDKIPKKFLDMANMIGLGPISKTRVHVQYPGEVFTQHIDKLAAFSWNPKDVTVQKIKRIVVFLTDWAPGHFYQFGNESVQGWRAGDIHTFDWPNVPHCTANAGHTPRVTLQMTGHETIVTKAFITKALNSQSIKV